MLFSESFCQERIPNGTRKRNVDDAAIMHMSDFAISEVKFPASKAMWMNRNLKPRGDNILQILQLLHRSGSTCVGCTSIFARFMLHTCRWRLVFHFVNSLAPVPPSIIYSADDHSPISANRKKQQFESVSSSCP